MVNEKRAERMRQLSLAKLREIAAAGTLSSAAARFEIERRSTEPDQAAPASA